MNKSTNKPEFSGEEHLNIHIQKKRFILNKPQNPQRHHVFSFPLRIQIMVIYLQFNQVRASKYVHCKAAKS